MAEVIRVRDQYYILSSSALADERTRVLKHGETFAVFDRHGDVRHLGVGEQGVYHEGTRFLSRYVLSLGEERPTLLGSTVTDDNTILAVDLTNPDLFEGDELVVPMGTLHLFRSRFLVDGVCYERIRVHNHGAHPVDVDLRLELESDFLDVFEVRGAVRERRGAVRGPVVDGSALVVAYDGLDGTTRTVRVTGTPRPQIAGDRLAFRERLEPQADASFEVTTACEVGDTAVELLGFDAALERRRREASRTRGGATRIDTANEQFNEWLNRSYADLRTMVTDTAYGPYPYAGIPWFSTPFGRDALITAYQALWVDPDIAAGVLRFLAATQATEVDPDREAEPGKILHEFRLGEMAATGEVPFGRYYGTADATPLFVLLAGAYHRATGDLDLVREIAPNIEAALGWIERYGDVDGDGFVEYEAHARTGLVQQGWKDSNDSVFHADGSPARAPIALCEVQGYVYGALREAAALYREMGEGPRAEELARRANSLRTAFEDAFWCPDIGTYALALDGEKRPCRVRTSNAGHLLLSGIVSSERAAVLAQTLMSDEMYSGWGVRTVASSEVRYRPISYHNGSVWPHDTSLIAHGLARYGFKDAAMRILTGLFDASLFFDVHRLPELWCGFHRRGGEGPTEYPLACSPQAWAAGSVFLVLRACLGLSVDGRHRRLTFRHPVLPESLERVDLTGLRVGPSSVDLTVYRYPTDVGIHIVSRTGDVEVVTVK